MTSLIDYFVNKGKIDKIDADKLKVQRSKSHVAEDELLLQSGLVDDVDVALAKSELFNIPYVDLKVARIDESLFGNLDVKRLQALKAVPYKKEGDAILVGIVDPFDIQAIQAIQHMLNNQKITVHIATEDAVNFVLNRFLGQSIKSEVSDALEDAEDELTDLDSVDTSDLSEDSIKNAPIARIVNSILQFAIKSKASDIHIEPTESSLRVRFRIYGVMTEKLQLPKKMASSIVARIKIMANLKIDEKRLPQDGRFPVVSAGSKVDVRVSILPTIYGEKVVLRLLDASGGVPPLETTGLRGSAYKKFLDAITATNGIILITGPTGSGKTRTLAGALDKLNKPSVNIITLENPVEIRIPGVTQVQINSDIGLTFASGLRSVLRQDPDIIMVGEIRDQETAKLAVEASLTGHLVLSTLHTNSSSAAIPRLIERGIEAYLLASTLRLVVAQRLPRRICRHCIEAYPAEPEVIEDIQKVLKTVPNFNVFKYVDKLCSAMKPDENGFKPQCPITNQDGSQGLFLYRGKGCDRCNGSGYSGRVGIFEVLDVTEEIGRMMMHEVSADDIAQVAIKNGMVTMLQDGYLKALEGITTIEEVLRVSRN